jgi:hypothetical protein
MECNQLYRYYISRYISAKYTNYVMYNVINDFNDWYSTKKAIINKPIDLVIYILPKQHLIGVIRSTLIFMLNNRYMSVEHRHMCVDYKQDKFVLLNNIIHDIPTFKAFFVLGLYSYI